MKLYQYFNTSGEPVRTKVSHPYNYDPILVWMIEGTPDGTVWTDHLFRDSPNRYNELCLKHFGDTRQYWGERDPEKIEAWLRDWLKYDWLKLLAITEYCNQATGFPLWQFRYWANHGNRP